MRQQHASVLTKLAAPPYRCLEGPGDTTTYSSQYFTDYGILVFPSKSSHEIHSQSGQTSGWPGLKTRGIFDSIVWVFRRLKKPRSHEMSARGYALHSVIIHLSFFSSLEIAYLVIAVEAATAAQAVVGSIVWACCRLKKVRQSGDERP